MEKISRKSMISNISIILGFVLIISSILIFVYQENRVDGIQKESRNLEEEFEKEIREKNLNSKNLDTKRERRTKKEENISKEKSGSDSSDEYERVYTKKADLKNKTLRETDTLGVMRIDKLGILLPIFSDTSDKNLGRGIGILNGGDEILSENGKVTVLAGHRGGRNEGQSFLKIDKLTNGDKIRITTANEILYYKVVGNEIIEKNDWSRFVPEKDKNIIYLLTCHPYPYDFKRLIVKAELYESKTAMDDM